MTLQSQDIPDHFVEALEALHVGDLHPQISFWSKYPDFDFDPDTCWESQFVELASSRKWKPDGKRYAKELRACYLYHCQSDSESDTTSHASSEGGADYGDIDPQLFHLQCLCRVVGLEPARSITQCKRLLKTVNVNLVNFVKAREAQEMPRLFPSYAALYLYTAKKRSRRMDRQTAKGLGLQVFLKTFYE